MLQAGAALFVRRVIPSVLFLLYPFAQAQERVLDTVTVSSSTIDDRFDGRRGEPSSVTEISGKAVDQRRPTNMIEMLQSVPGVTADLSSGDELKIKFRGVENQLYMGEKPGVAIVIDGVPVFERTGKVNIDLDNIESIKVIKGGASYLFGEDALAGAVVITTKRGAKYAGVTASVDAGSWNYQRQLVRAGVAGGWGSGHIQATHRETDDYYFRSGYRTDYVDGSLRFNLTDASDLTVNFENSERQKDKHGNVTGATQAQVDPRGTLGRDYARQFDVNLQKLNATYAHDLGNGSNLLATVYQYKDHTTFWSAPQRYSTTGVAVTDNNAYTTLNNYHQTQNGAKAELRGQGGQMAWMGGADLRRNEYLNLNTALRAYCSRPGGACPVTAAGTVFQDDKTREAVQAAYGELKWAPVADWVFTGNLRGDQIDLDYRGAPNNENPAPVRFKKSFSALSWRLGSNWQASKDTNLFANVSTGFRTPTVAQLFGGSISPTGGKTRNNENLRPETSMNYEVGANGDYQLLGLAFNVQTSLFRIDRKDFIMSVNGDYGASSTTFQQYYDNIGGVRNQGLELAIKTDPKREWGLDVAYTFVDARFTSYENLNRTLGNSYANCTPTAVPSNTGCRIVRSNATGNRVPRVARNSLFTTLHWRPRPGLRIDTEMDAREWSFADEINQEKIPGRTLFNLAAYYDLDNAKSTFLGGKWSVFARVDNVFDRKYWQTARGTNDASGYLPGMTGYNGVYNAEDLSIIVGKPRYWTAGITATF